MSWDIEERVIQNRTRSHEARVEVGVSNRDKKNNIRLEMRWMFYNKLDRILFLENDIELRRLFYRCEGRILFGFNRV